LTGGQECINLLFPGWTLDTAGKFAAAMIGVFFMALFLEGLSKYRHYLSECGKGAPKSKKQHFKLGITALHGVQAILGYAVMLISMTFSAELLFMIISGLKSGHYVFFQLRNNDGDEEGMDKRTASNLSSIHVTSNPCCQFMEEESKEIANHRSSDRNDFTVVMNETVMGDGSDGSGECCEPCCEPNTNNLASISEETA
jgi:copper transporter 1